MFFLTLSSASEKCFTFPRGVLIGRFSRFGLNVHYSSSFSSFTSTDDLPAFLGSKDL
jgi:hypothetical protein